jgi:hypothetical protein
MEAVERLNHARRRFTGVEPERWVVDRLTDADGDVGSEG